jgi:hypothetical protein
MDIARFIPCLVKTVNSALCIAREHWEANKAKLETMDYLPETLCPNGKRLRMHNLYGTTVEIRYEDLFVPCMQVKPTGITLLVSFEIDGFLQNFRFSSSTILNEEMIRKYFAHIFYCKTIQINKYLENLEEINETLESLPQ